MNKKHLTPLLISSLIIFLVLWIIFSFTFVVSKSLSLSYAKLILINLIPAALSTAIILGAFSVASPLINDFLVTFRRLLRIDNLSNPLLLKLSLQAPGTYHHSINVSNLAQNAAKSIGADSLLVRVAAYYHDIGKIENPDFFVENQSQDHSHEANESPKKSAKQIIAHVENGLKLAKANKLTDEICDLIAQHHGTTLVNYFFTVASRNDGASLRDDYRYPGPKPSSREAAILMISDSVEAAMRSLSDVRQVDISKLISDIISQRVNDGQLENSGLSDHDLRQIEKSLIDTVTVINHRRILK